MTLGPIKDWRFTTNDTAPLRVSKLEAARASILSLLSASEGGLKGRLSDVLQNPGFWPPENVPALTQGSLVPIEGEGDVLQTQGAISLAPHAWEEIEGDRSYESYWRFRIIKNDPSGEVVEPETGFFIYDAYGSYLGTHATTISPAVTVSSGWQDYSNITNGTAIKDQYPAAVYARPALMRGDEGIAISQVSRFRMTDVTDIEGVAAMFEGVYAAISLERTARMGETGALASLITTLTASVATDIGTLTSNIELEATARAGGDSANAELIATLDSTVGELSAEVIIHASTLVTLEGYAEARLELVTVAGSGRAQLTLHADANGGGGVDIVGDVSIDGDLMVTGSVPWEKLDLSTLVRKVTATGSGATPAAGASIVLAEESLGDTYPNGSYQLDIICGFQTNVGRVTADYMGLPFYTNYLSDGGLVVEIIKDGSVLGSSTFNASEYDASVSATRTVGYTRVDLFDVDDATLNEATVRLTAYRGNVDTGIVDEGDYYIRDVSATYTGVAATVRAKWVFI